MNAPHIFTAGVAAIEALAAADGADAAIDPRCVPYVLHHGAATERAIVLFHGFTNCPRQFSALAQQFFERGFNVYVPRLPRHGLRDKLTTELAGSRPTSSLLAPTKRSRWPRRSPQASACSDCLPAQHSRRGSPKRRPLTAP